MKIKEKYSIVLIVGEDGGLSYYYNTEEEAMDAAKKLANESMFTAWEIKKRQPHVLISRVILNEDGEEIEYIDSVDAVYITEPAYS